MQLQFWGTIRRPTTRAPLLDGNGIPNTLRRRRPNIKGNFFRRLTIQRKHDHINQTPGRRSKRLSNKRRHNRVLISTLSRDLPRREQDLPVIQKTNFTLRLTNRKEAGTLNHLMKVRLSMVPNAPLKLSANNIRRRHPLRHRQRQTTKRRFTTSTPTGEIISGHGNFRPRNNNRNRHPISMVIRHP